MNEHLSFEFEGNEYTSRLVTVGDFAAIKELIRRQRLSAISNKNVDLQAAVISRPVPYSEVMDMLFSVEGQALVLYRCVSAMNESFTKDMADRMVMEDNPFLKRLLTESKVIEADPLEPQQD